MQPLTEADYQLSMKIGKRPRNERHTLRTLLVHRLRDAHKAIARLSLSKNLAHADDASDYSVLCEPCDIWVPLPEWGEEFSCPGCDTLYALEFAIFSAIKQPSQD